MRALPGFKVCRFGELVKGDRFLDPSSGDLVKVDSILRSGIMCTAVITVVGEYVAKNLTLHNRRWMRRKLREGETQ